MWNKKEQEILLTLILKANWVKYSKLFILYIILVNKKQWTLNIFFIRNNTPSEHVTYVTYIKYIIRLIFCYAWCQSHGIFLCPIC